MYVDRETGVAQDDGAYIVNGQGQGVIGQTLFGTRGRFDPGLWRPYIETDPNSRYRGKPVADVTVGMIYNNTTGNHEPLRRKFLISYLNSRGVNNPVLNAGTYFTRDDWAQIDRVVQRVPRQRMTLWPDMRAANSYPAFDAWAHLTLEYSTASEAGEAVVDMTGLAPARDDRQLMQNLSIPLPITHSDISIPQRELDVSRLSRLPFDTNMLEQCTRRCWESVEKTATGTETGMTYGTRSTGPFPMTGTSTVYGLTNFPYRITKTNLTAPTGANPEAVLNDVLAMVNTMNDNNYFGPFVLYHSTPYSQYLPNDYFRSGSTATSRTLRNRILEIPDISDVRRLDFLTSGFQFILVSYGEGQIQAVPGMEPRTIQWSERGGMLQKFMVMMIQVPLIRTTYNAVSCILHATTS